MIIGINHWRKLKMDNQRLNFFKETIYEVVDGVDLVTPFNIFLGPIFPILQDGNSRFMCAFNCVLFLNPINCFDDMNNTNNQYLNNFRLIR